MSSIHTKKPIFDNSDPASRRKLMSPVSQSCGRSFDLRTSMIKQTELGLIASINQSSPFKGYDSYNTNQDFLNDEDDGCKMDNKFLKHSSSTAASLEKFSQVLPELKREMHEFFASFIKNEFGQTIRDISLIKEKLISHQNKIEKNDKHILDLNLTLKRILEGQDSMFSNYKQATRSQLESFAKEPKSDFTQKNQDLEKEIQKLSESCVFLSDKVDETIASSTLMNQSMTMNGVIPEDTCRQINELRQKCEDNRLLNKCQLESFRTDINNKLNGLERELGSRVEALKLENNALTQLFQKEGKDNQKAEVNHLERKISELECGLDTIKSRLEEKNKFVEENMETIKKKMSELSPFSTAKKNQENLEGDWLRQNQVTDSNEYFERKATLAKNFTINFQDSVSKIPKRLNQNAILGEEEFVVSQELNFENYQKLNDKFKGEEQKIDFMQGSSPANDDKWFEKYQEEMRRNMKDEVALNPLQEPPVSELILPDKKSITHQRSTTPHSFGRYEKVNENPVDSSLEMPQIRKFESNDGKDVVTMDDSFNIEDRFVVRIPVEVKNRDSDFKKFQDEIDEEQSKKSLLNANSKNEFLDDSVNIGLRDKDLEEDSLEYQIDEDGNLFDEEGNVLVDEKGDNIKLNEEHIDFLRRSNMLYEEN